MRRFVFFCLICTVIASGFVGYAVGYLQVGAECVKVYNVGVKLNYEAGYEAGYQKGLEDMAEECVKQRNQQPVPIRPRPKNPGPRA